MGRYFEEFRVGESFETRSSRIERETILNFASLTGDDNPLHTDVAFMVDSQFGDVIAHGLLLESIAIGLIAELGIMQETTIALLEANCRFRHFAIPGDEVRVVMTVSDKRPTSRADRGILHRRVRMLNQRDELVLESDLVSLMRCRALPD